MAKYTFQWKDPDYTITGNEHLDDVILHKLRELGIGEYVVIEIDTDTMTTRVVPPKRR